MVYIMIVGELLELMAAKKFIMIFSLSLSCRIFQQEMNAMLYSSEAIGEYTSASVEHAYRIGDGL